MALSQYNRFANDLADGLHAFEADDMRLFLMTTAYTFSAAHNTTADLTNEVTGTNYSAGGLPWDTASASTGDNTCEITAADEVVAQDGSGFADALKYALQNADKSNALITYGAAGGVFGNVAGQLTIDYPANFLTITV